MTRMMKETGIEWIGKVPSDWEIAKLSKISFIKTGNTPSGDVFSDDDGINWIKTNNLLEEKGTSIAALKIRNEFIGNSVVSNVGATLVSCIGDIGKMAYVKYPVAYNQQINSVKFKDIIYDKFGFYALYAQKDQHKSLSNGNVLKILNSFNQGLVSIVFPNYKEQKRIADYLDKKCTEIEGVKESIEAEIKTLEEYKKSMITEAVTKGLDKDCEMKDSGIEWIGAVPKHWRKGKIKQICKIIGSGTTPLSSNFNYYSDGKYNWIQSGDLYKQDKIVKTEKMITQEALDSYLSLKVYKSPFLVMAMYGASVGNLSLSLIDAATNQACCVMKNDKDNDLIYMYYWLTFVKNDLLMKAEGGSQPNISQDKIKNQFIFTPPINEQKAIADYLDHKTNLINEAIEGKKAQLLSLDEYKKSLIYEYVTGKKEVPHEDAL